MVLVLPLGAPVDALSLGRACWVPCSWRWFGLACALVWCCSLLSVTLASVVALGFVGLASGLAFGPQP